MASLPMQRLQHPEHIQEGQCVLPAICVRNKSCVTFATLEAVFSVGLSFDAQKLLFGFMLTNSGACNVTHEVGKSGSALGGVCDFYSRKGKCLDVNILENVLQWGGIAETCPHPCKRDPSSVGRLRELLLSAPRRPWTG